MRDERIEHGKDDSRQERTEELEENQSQALLYPHKYHMDCPGIESWPP
jgi:hypothetical protein